MRETWTGTEPTKLVSYILSTTANGDKTEVIIGSILEYLCTKIQRKVNHGKMFNISFEEFLVLSENYPYFCRTI